MLKFFFHWLQVGPERPLLQIFVKFGHDTLMLQQLTRKFIDSLLHVR
jgi:hypothetical protein